MEPDDAILTDEQLALMWKLSPSTLRHWRSANEGPPYFKLGGRLVRYRWSEVQAWMDENRAVAS